VIGTRSRVLAVTLAIGCLTAHAALAQQLVGTALDPNGEPLAGEPVALHRVGGGAGAFVGTDTTGADGRFQFELASDSAVYFAAVRYQGRMYIGPAVQAGVAAPAANYVLQVDPANEAGAVASALSGSQAARPRTTAPGGAGSSDAGALMLVGLLALAAALAFFFAAPRYREKRTRQTLIELAAVENDLADSPDPKDRAQLEADRDRLRSRLAPRS
jgi:hypothetical protein